MIKNGSVTVSISEWLERGFWLDGLVQSDLSFQKSWVTFVGCLPAACSLKCLSLLCETVCHLRTVCHKFWGVWVYVRAGEMAEYMSSQSSSSDSEFHNENTEVLSYEHLETIPDSAILRSGELVSLQLNNNDILQLPSSIGCFSRLVTLDISNNSMKKLCTELCQLRNLRTFVAKNNQLSSSALPKDFGLLQNLEVVNLSGNHFTDLAPQITELYRLKCLYLGSNRLVELSSAVKHLLRWVSTVSHASPFPPPLVHET